jgi:hypothetical protein
MTFILRIRQTTLNSPQRLTDFTSMSESKSEKSSDISVYTSIRFLAARVKFTTSRHTQTNSDAYFRPRHMLSITCRIDCVSRTISHCIQGLETLITAQNGGATENIAFAFQSSNPFKKLDHRDRILAIKPPNLVCINCY